MVVPVSSNWLVEERFYTSINCVSKNLGTIFFPPALKIHYYFDENEILVKCWNYKEWINIFVDFQGFTQFVSDSPEFTDQ